MAVEDTSRAQEIIERIRRSAPPDDQRLHNYLAALEAEIETGRRERAQIEETLSEYEEAYNKLTAPANRIGVFLMRLEDEGQALVALGDTEYVVNVDPKIDLDSLQTGARVRLNEGYSVVGLVPDTDQGAIVKVSEVLADGRLRVGGDTPGSTSRFVGRSMVLSGAAIEAGDEIRLDASSRVAVEHFPKKETKELFIEEVPEIPWEAVGGQEHAIQLIRDTIEHPLLYPDVYRRFDQKPIKGVLLYGPPGCGKTLIGKATAYNLTHEYSKRVGHEVKHVFMYISGPKILNMWLGETERMVREIFEVARSKAKEGRLVFIFMDEAESVLRTRSSGRWLNISNTVVPQFCAELDGLVALDNVVLMLTSNRPDYIDPAVLRPERINRKVKVNRPDRAAARQILSIYLHDRLPIDPELLAKHGGDAACARAELVERTTDFVWRENKSTEFLRVFLRNGQTETLYWHDLVSGALLKSIVDRAKDYAIKRSIQDESVEHGVSIEDLQAATEAEYKENEIFPKTDTQEDWLKLLDYEPDNVATVKPVSHRARTELSRKPVI
ncbi:MAG: AAA family ATPase [Fimbriimonadaceae bacterium]